MANNENDYSNPHYLPSEGNRGFRALCGLASALGAKDPFHQMLNNDGTCVGDLMVFLEENPGAIQAIYDWAEENCADELEEMAGDDELESEDPIDSEEPDSTEDWEGSRRRP